VIRSDPIQIPTMHFDIMSTCHGWADESTDVTDILSIDATDISNRVSVFSFECTLCSKYVVNCSCLNSLFVLEFCVSVPLENIILSQ
jgi:hypothetical protein